MYPIFMLYIQLMHYITIILQIALSGIYVLPCIYKYITCTGLILMFLCKMERLLTIKGYIHNLVLCNIYYYTRKFSK